MSHSIKYHGRRLKHSGMITIWFFFFRLPVKEDFSEEATAKLRLDAYSKLEPIGIWGKGIPKENQSALMWESKEEIRL